MALCGKALRSSLLLSGACAADVVDSLTHTHFFPTAMWLFLCCSFISSQNALFLPPGKFCAIPWNPVPASSSSLWVYTLLPLIFIMTCLYLCLYPRSVALSHRFILYTCQLQHLLPPMVFNYSHMCLVFPRLWVPWRWGYSSIYF